MLPNGVFHYLATVSQFMAHARGRDKNQVGMIVGMVADLMACLLDRAVNFRPLTHVFSNQKESCPGPKSGKHVKQAHGVGIVRAIVKSERHLRGIAAMGERVPVKLRERRHGGVTSVAGGSGRSQSCESQQHFVSW